MDTPHRMTPPHQIFSLPGGNGSSHLGDHNSAKTVNDDRAARDARKRNNVAFPGQTLGGVPLPGNAGGDIPHLQGWLDRPGVSDKLKAWGSNHPDRVTLMESRFPIGTAIGDLFRRLFG